MSRFVVESCAVKGCANWRDKDGNNCAKNGLNIAAELRFAAMMKDSAECQIRQQMNEFRLTKLLDDRYENIK